ncbi:a disintegrin and metalloproteinase with thrombospondin motifs 9 [Paragonimus westermani]|uniref:A disintegrin and metalloproteinase with thrombospondin motifs 9 n=1 Tax=Paragonimus westermani TaxID=34504 RepID=A0A5J4P2G0_9TREM|nr:a disintegrin and metalloproteinase with thrombospondin motifs 9 [Paragonimus westermani]
MESVDGGTGKVFSVGMLGVRTFRLLVGEATACALTCLDNGQAIHHGISIPDGTPCYAQRDDICIKGVCWETGCDGVLGSTQRFDRCRVCGGDNSTCVEVSGVFTGDSTSSIGMHPRVIFEELKTQIRRGETREPFSGAELYYSGSRSAEEVVSITGRLQKDVNIVIRVENSQTTRPLPPIEYHYFVDKDQRHNPLFFIAEEEARLAAMRSTLRTGRSNTSPTAKPHPFSSIQPSSGNVAGNGGGRDPNLVDMERQRPIVHFVWRISELPTGCSTCTGNSTSYAECYPLVNDDATRRYFSEHDFYRPVAEYLCSAMPRPPPVVRRCADYCGVRWSAKPTTSTSTDVGDVTSSNGCSVRCGEGVQSATYVCEEFVVPAEQKDKTKGLWRVAQLGERACMRAGLGPTPTQPAIVRCQGTCEPVYWMTSNWSECSASCAIGDRHRYLHCQQNNGRGWQLQECFSQGELTHTSDPTPSGSIPHQEAIKILLKHVEQGQLNANVGKQLGYQQSETCISLSECHNQIQWIATPWSECQLMTDSMRVLCRSVGYNDVYTNPASANLIAMRTRHVYCQLDLPTVHSSLGQYMEVTDEATPTVTSARPPWRMKMEFCRKATHLLPGFPTEPVNRESCERPFCYRWGQAKISECSTTCGPGFKTATVPCERVTLDLRSISTTSLDPQHHHQQRFSPPAHWVEQASLNECHNQLGYSPRIFLSADNQSLHVETIERPFDEQQGTELKGISLDKLIQVNCFNKPCITNIVAWHTSGWSQCSVTCGTGVRRRQVLCMLETHGRSPGGTYHSHADNHILSGSRLSAELTDSQRCLDASLPKPPDQEPCDGGPCPQWLPDAWSQCEGTCEFGIQHRHVRCVLDTSLSKSAEAKSSTSDSDRTHILLFPSTKNRQHVRRNRATHLIEVEPERCQGGGAIPITKRICLLPGGCPFWHKEEWSSCSVECGVGRRVRSVKCQFPNGSSVYVPTHTESPTGLNEYSLHSLDNHDRFTVETITHLVESRSNQLTCPSPRPMQEITCKTRPCTGTRPFWWPVMVSECDSHTCAVGRRTRVIRCLTATLGPIEDSACRHLARPTDWTPCVPLNCMRFEWRGDPWSQCPRGCGARSQYRRVRCVDSFGEEYSNSLCPSHLKPQNWQTCLDRCAISQSNSASPRNCAEIRIRFPGAKDGTFQILIGHAHLAVYCADMESVTPKEYIVLRRVNYAQTGGFLQPPSTSHWCPPVTGLDSLNPKELHQTVAPLLDTANLSEHEFVFKREVSAANCPTCPFLSNLASVTYYQKIRLNLNQMKVEIEDTRFAYTVGTSNVPYGTAKDCFGSQICPQGRFQIDLRETGFRVSVKTHWEKSREDSAAHIYRSENGKVVSGHCGGRCSGCWPRPDLLLEVSKDEIR